MTLYRTIQITDELELRPPRDTGGRGRGLAHVIVAGTASDALDREDLELLRDAIDEALDV